MSSPSPPTSGTFFSEQYALEHLCDHVLTRPEAHEWALVLPGYSSLVSPTDDAALHAIAASLYSSSPSAKGVELLKEYLGALRRAIDEALRLGWWWEQKQGRYREWSGLGLEGVFVVWNADTILTGYLPASSRYRAGADPRPRIENPLPRRDPAERIRPPPPDSPRRRHQLYSSSHYCVSEKYARIYEEITQAGGDVFVDPLKSMRIGKWQQLLAERPAR